jgi:hypothetical protein
VTFAVSEFNASERAFTDCLQYEVVERGAVSAELARFWQAGRCAGRRYALLRPASGEAVHIRLVEAPPVQGYGPLKTWGWNAAELHVQDVHGLAESLAASPFRIIGGPRDLLDDGTVVAMQVLGPSDELLYLTQISDPLMQGTYGRALSSVGRVFIAVLGSGNHRQSIEFYRQQAALVTEPRELAIRVLATAHGLDPLNSRFSIASAAMADRYRIEIDAYPPTAKRRAVPDGELPPGLSMVSLAVSDLAAIDWPVSRHWAGGAALPYRGSDLALVLGPSGEWIELIEDSPAETAGA